MSNTKHFKTFKVTEYTNQQGKCCINLTFTDPTIASVMQPFEAQADSFEECRDMCTPVILQAMKFLDDLLKNNVKS